MECSVPRLGGLQQMPGKHDLPGADTLGWRVTYCLRLPSVVLLQRFRAQQLLQASAFNFFNVAGLYVTPSNSSRPEMTLTR
jgi:hypothetical protein